MPRPTGHLIILTIGGKDYGYGHLARVVPIYDAFDEISIPVKLYVLGDKSAYGIIENRNAVFTDWINNLVDIDTEDIIVFDVLEPSLELIRKYQKFTSEVYVVSDKKDTASLPYKVINWRVGAAKLNADNGLYGEEYVPLREELLSIKKRRNEPNAQKIQVLISMGAGDVINLIPKSLDFLMRDFGSKIHFKVVIRSFHPEFEKVMKSYGQEATFLVDVSADKLFREIASCDFAIASGGHTIYELAYLGVPVVHVLVVDNQLPAKCWDDSGFTYPIGMYRAEEYETLVNKGVEYFLNKQNRQKSSETGRLLIDGRGAERIRNKLFQSI